MNIRENVLLAPFTSFHIGGKARYFCSVRTVVELKEAFSYARQRGTPFFILGGGTNILFSDDGYNGLVIKINLKGTLFETQIDGDVRAYVSAGESWDMFVSETVKRNLFGIENLSAIPGMVGAAPVQNIGAYGQEAKETIECVDVFDTRKQEIKRLSADECAFGYRDSIFKKEEGRAFIVLGAAFSLRRRGELNHSYEGICDYFEKNKIASPTLSDTREAIIALREAKLPDIKKVGTAGSFFKNPIISEKEAAILKQNFPAIPLRKHNGGFKISAAWLIEHVANMKGERQGDAGTHEHQPLVLVNHNSATARDIISFSEIIKEKIFEKTGILFEREVLVV